MYNEEFTFRALEFLRAAVRKDSEADLDTKSKLDAIFADRERAANLYAFIHWADMAGKLTDGDRNVAGLFLSAYSDRLHYRSKLAHTVSLSIAAADIRNGLEEGTECQVCGQRAKEYKRKLNTNMAIFMRSLVKAHYVSIATGGDGWIHHSDLEYTGRDYTMCAFWNLARTERDQADEVGQRAKKTTGYWWPTPEGIEFVRGKLAVRKYIYMFNGSCREDTDSSYITFEQALGERFVFSELFNKEEITNEQQ